MLYYIYNGDELLGFVYKDKTYYYHKNMSGDIIGILDSNYNEIVTYEYDSWGALVNIIDNSDINLGTINPFRYRSYYFDEETGLYYLNSRYYNPQFGRFINADDSTGSGEVIVSYNNFQYAFNNIVNFKDDDGQWPKLSRLVKVAIGIGSAAIGVAVAVIDGSTLGPVLAIAAGITAVGAVIGGAIGAISSASNYKKKTGTLKGGKDAILNGAADGVATGTMVGGIIAGTTLVATTVKGVKITGFTKEAYPGIMYKYLRDGDATREAIRSLELHPPHDGNPIHNFWHLQINKFSYKEGILTRGSAQERIRIFSKEVIEFIWEKIIGK